MRYVLVAAVLVTLCPAMAFGQDLFKDGGFEDLKRAPDQYGNAFTQWKGWTWDGSPQRLVDKEVKHGGASSALLTNAKGNCWEAIWQSTPTVAGFYKVTGYVRAEGLQPGKWKMGARLGFEPGVGKGMLDPLPFGTWGWRKFERIYRFTEDSPKNSFHVNFLGSGKAWIDDLTLEKLEGDDHVVGFTLHDPEAAEK